MDSTTALAWSDFSDIASAITSVWSVSTIVGILAGLIGVGVTFTLLWWGVRKTTRSIMSAVKRGRISV